MIFHGPFRQKRCKWPFYEPFRSYFFVGIWSHSGRRASTRAKPSTSSSTSSSLWPWPRGWSRDHRDGPIRWRGATSPQSLFDGFIGNGDRNVISKCYELLKGPCHVQNVFHVWIDLSNDFYETLLLKHKLCYKQTEISRDFWCCANNIRISYFKLSKVSA